MTANYHGMVYLEFCLDDRDVGILLSKVRHEANNAKLLTPDSYGLWHSL